MFKGFTFWYVPLTNNSCSGTLSMVRREFEDMIKQEGGKCSASVTNSTTHLVTTDSDYTGGTSKVQQAKGKGIHIVDENFVTDSIDHGALEQEEDHYFEKPVQTQRKQKTPKLPKATSTTTTTQTPSSYDVVWNWEDDEDNWKPFDQVHIDQIETAYQKNPNGRAVLVIGKNVYTILFSNMTQENVATKFGRPVQRIAPTVTSTITTSSTTSTPQLPPLGVAWEWQDNDDSWKAFSDQNMRNFEAEYIKGNFSTNFTFGSTRYDVDLAKMTQLNTSTKYERKIRRRDLLKTPNVVETIIEEEKPTMKRPRNDSEESTTMKRVLVKGKAAVDESSGVADTGVIHEEDKDIYSVMLNQTDVDAGVYGHNKFYLIQLIDTPKGFTVFNKWGRVGSNGQKSVKNYGDLDDAKTDFFKKFKDKTGCAFEDRADMKPKKGKYIMVEIDYHSDEPTEIESIVEEDKSQEVKPDDTPQVKLDPRIRELIKFIGNVVDMERQMMEYHIDIKKMPLGKLSKTQIIKGYSVLKEILDAIQSGEDDLGHLSSQFYSLIPHDFGRKRPTLIDDEQLVRMKMDMLANLGEMEIATKLLKSNTKQQDQVLATYLGLNINLQPIEPTTDTWKMVEKMIVNTHGSTHTDYGLKLIDVFDVERQGERKKFKSNIKNRRLLWHGSRSTNFIGILSQGLRIAPPESPITGYMFGKGVYFADSVSKSANYCHANDIGCLLLCEVALGEMYPKEHAEMITKLKHPYESTMGLGKYAPDPKDDITLEDGTIVSVGKMINQKGVSNKSDLLYNEFIVYDVDQVVIKYMVKVKFEWN